jgi:hypothetical protein
MAFHDVFPARTGRPSVEQEGADLVDHTGALANQPFANPMQRLQIELLDRFDGDTDRRDRRQSN